MFILCYLVLMICSRFIVESNVATIYDQRQTGKLNVQVKLKDLQVVALTNSELDDYTDYDYFYDYADFTIKPGNKPTTSSTTETSTQKTKVTEIMDTSSVQHSTSTTSSIPTSSDEIANLTEYVTTMVYDGGKPNTVPSSSTHVTLNNSDIDKTQLYDNDGSQSSTVASSTIQSTVTEPVKNLRGIRRCRSGFISDYRGRCQPLSALLVHIMP